MTLPLDIKAIQQILPHRFPFLLVDRITDLKAGQSARAIKCVSANEGHFQGHFPKEPVMPGVLIIEALAQTGAIALLSMEEHHGKLAYFAGINKCRFRKKVIPGDVLQLEVTLTKFKMGMGFGQAVASVAGEVVAEAEIMFALEK